MKGNLNLYLSPQKHCRELQSTVITFPRTPAWVETTIYQRQIVRSVGLQRHSLPDSKQGKESQRLCLLGNKKEICSFFPVISRPQFWIYFAEAKWEKKKWGKDYTLWGDDSKQVLCNRNRNEWKVCRKALLQKICHL